MAVFSLYLHQNLNDSTMNRLTIFLLITLPLFSACTQKEQDVRVESVSVNPNTASLTIGETLQLKASVSPSSATKKDVTWSSSKPSVASVSASGLVTAVSEGTTTIIATADGKKGECAVSVSKGYIAVSEVKLNKTDLKLYEGEEETLTATVLPENATDKTVTWSSSDKSIATVESGKVKAVKKGEATITAKAGDKSVDIKVVVLTPISGISLNKDNIELYIGETETLTATISPADASLKEPIEWSSSNESTATVEGGKITAVGKGTAIITAKAGGKSASCSVTVLKPVSGISLDKTSLELSADGSETLTANIVPSDSTPREEIQWSSSNTQVATVDNGKVTAVSMGSTTITASLEGYKAECNVVVKGMEYGKIAITNLKPVDILPVIGQVDLGDKQCYDHIEHLRLAEATRIRDMMWEYGAGDYSKNEYRQLMERLNAGMMCECPLGYDNFEIIGGGQYGSTTGEHSGAEWSILSYLIQHANLKVVFNGGMMFQEKLADYLNNNPNAILIMGCSAFGETTRKESFLKWTENESVREMCKSGHLLIFKSGGNVYTEDGVLVNKTYHRDVDEDGYGLYSLQSNANGAHDSNADIALLVTIGTNDKGDADQTGMIYGSSCFPVGFHDKALFAGRAFPFRRYPTEEIWAEKESVRAYETSYVNYVNVAMMSICFQMYAEVKDVFELLDMVRATCLTDYIRLDGQTQPLQLINPAGLYKKYLTPQNLPTAISSNETLSLDKGYYKGVLFCIPGAEVKINGEWVAFDNKNKDVILSLNPMNLEWRLNGDLIRKYGYTSGQTIEGQIITVDDKWGGLRLEIPMKVQLR